MSQSNNAWEATSPRDSLVDPHEPVRVTVQLWTAGKGKRKINQYSKRSRIGKGLQGEVYLCDVDNDSDQKVVSPLNVCAAAAATLTPSRPSKLSNAAVPATKLNFSEGTTSRMKQLHRRGHTHRTALRTVFEKRSRL
jgi:hypothetical protein